MRRGKTPDFGHLSRRGDLKTKVLLFMESVHPTPQSARMVSHATLLDFKTITTVMRRLKVEGYFQPPTKVGRTPMFVLKEGWIGNIKPTNR